MAGPTRRQRNPRGEGERLRAEILAAATAILEETGNEEAVTLRGVARRAGIAAPSIYGHFPDVSAVVDAVIAQAFSELDSILERSVWETEGAPARARLRALCAAYLDFARRHPLRYRVMFARFHGSPTTDARASSYEDLHGGKAFSLLVGAVGQVAASHVGCSDPDDPFLQATMLWVALHGWASLESAVPVFSWPPNDAMLDRLIQTIR